MYHETGLLELRLGCCRTYSFYEKLDQYFVKPFALGPVLFLSLVRYRPTILINQFITELVRKYTLIPKIIFLCLLLLSLIQL